MLNWNKRRFDFKIKNNNEEIVDQTFTNSLNSDTLRHLEKWAKDTCKNRGICFIEVTDYDEDDWKSFSLNDFVSWLYFRNNAPTDWLVDGF